MQRGKLITKITRLRNSPDKRSKIIKPSIRGSPSIDNSYYNNNSNVFDTSQQIANISGVQRQSLLLQTLVSGKELKSTQSSNFKKSVIQNKEQIMENNEKEKSGEKKYENLNSQYNSENQDQKINLENIEKQFQYSDEKYQGQSQNLDANQNYSQIDDLNFQNQKTPENQNFKGKQKSITNLTNEHNISYSPITKVQTSQKKQLSPGQASNLLKVNYIQSTQKIYQENQNEEQQQNNITSFVNENENQDNQKNDNQTDNYFLKTVFEEQFEESQQDLKQKELEQNKVENINYQQQQDQQENNYQILNQNNQSNKIFNNNDSQNMSEQQQFTSNQKNNFDNQQKQQQSSSQINEELDQEIKKIENLLIQVKNKKLKCQEILKESLQKFMELENLPENIQNIVKKKIEGFQSQQSDIESINENYDLNISNFLNNSVNQNQIKSILKQKLDQIDQYMREQEIFQDEAQFYQNLYNNQKIMLDKEQENEKKSQEQSQIQIQQEQSLKFQEYLQIQQQEQSKKEKEQELKMQKIQEQMQNQIQQMMGQNLQQFLDNFNLVQKQQLEAQQQIIKEHQEQQKLMAQQMEEQMQKYKNQQDILQNYKEMYDQLKSKQEELNNQLVQNMEDKKNLQEQSQNNSLQILEKEKKENEEKIKHIQELQNQILQKIDIQQQFNKQELQQYLNKIEEQKFDMQQEQQKNDQLFQEQKQQQMNLQQKEEQVTKQNEELISNQMETQPNNGINKDNSQQQLDQDQQQKLQIDDDQQNLNDRETERAENITTIDQNDIKPQLDEQIISQESKNQNDEIIENQDYYLKQQHLKLKENTLLQQESQVSDLLLEKTDNTNQNYNDKNINKNENENDENQQNNQKETEKLFLNSNNNIDQNTYILKSNQDDYCQGSQLQENNGNQEKKQQQNFDETMEQQQQQNQQQQEQSNEQEQLLQLQEQQNNSNCQQELSFEQNNQMQENQIEDQIEPNQQSFQQNNGNEIDSQQDQNMFGQDQQQQEQQNFNQQENEQQNLNQNIIDKENKQIILNKNDETIQKSIEEIPMDQQQQNQQDQENECINIQEQEQQQQQQQMLQEKNQIQNEQNQNNTNIQNQKQKYSLHEITAKTTPDQTPKSFSKQEFKEIYNEYMQNPIVASQQRILNQLKRVQDEQNYNQLHRCSPSKSLPNFNQVKQQQQQTYLEKELFMKNIQQIFESMKERQKKDKQKLNFRHSTQNNLIAPQDTDEIGKIQQDYSQIENEDELRSDAIDYELQQNNQNSSNHIEQKCDQNYISKKDNENSQQKQIQQNSFLNIEENSLNQSVKNFESFKTSQKKQDIKKAHIDFSQQKFKINNFNFEKNNSMTQTMPSWKIRHENSKQNSINRMQKSNKSQGRVNQQKVIEVSRNHNDYLTDFGRCVDKNIQEEILKKNLIIENPEDFDLIDKLVIYQKSLEDMGQLGYKVGKILAKSNNQSKYNSVNQIQSLSQIIN
ncbi:hypothetical protein PPERSA_08860 [Pseudocohnilembus persalinus]|uniref:Uncharacterized protein n=1 Tax=Pseudocohnilembus persalinus TaxID=266149 RepID=A0A0V0R4K5_PSEPJ|nr:hypothetical protein PPERSA_08860 [Pseudocohnilembus persalinus]|eukprot:KRX09144.1 hypothetical protein PPERSA_08860 [Pseudocohnilembus persalinus]